MLVKKDSSLLATAKNVAAILKAFIGPFTIHQIMNL